MLIGLCGFKRSGKDTVAIGLAQQYGFERFAFADAIREEVAALDGISRPDETQKDVRSTNGQSYRDALIARGQARRSEDPDYWVKALASSIAQPPVPANIVITDCRIPNEVDWIRSRGGVLVWVWRDGIVSNGHVTERDWRPVCDIVLHNDWRTPDELAAELMLAARARARVAA